MHRPRKHTSLVLALLLGIIDLVERFSARPPRVRSSHDPAAVWIRETVTHEEKVNHLIAECEEPRLPRREVVPPVYRLLWAFGFRIRPPHFQGFAARFVTIAATSFGIASLISSVVYVSLPGVFGLYEETSNPLLLPLVLLEDLPRPGPGQGIKG